MQGCEGELSLPISLNPSGGGVGGGDNQGGHGRGRERKVMVDGALGGQP